MRLRDRIAEVVSAAAVWLAILLLLAVGWVLLALSARVDILAARLTRIGG